MRALDQRKHRQREGAAVVHGTQPVRQAVEAGFEVENLVVAPELLREGTARFVAEQRERGTRVTTVTGELFARLSDRDRPTGLAAIVRVRLADAAEVAPGTGRASVVALDRVANPGNLGTIVRTADATGAAGVLLVGPTADPFDPAAIKASMGAIFNVPVARVSDVDELFAWARERGVAVVTTSAKAPHRLWRTEYPERVALLMGTEGDGLADDVVERGDLRVSIPMVGTAESLNLAVATSVLLYDLWRFRETGA
nr:RNA methyltransferase [Saccharothrix syringae]